MSGLTGTVRLTRLALRRDRVTLPAWILGLGFFIAATTAMFNKSLADPVDLVRETQLVATNAEGIETRFFVDVLLLTPKEVEYFRHGGILQYVLRQLAA